MAMWARSVRERDEARDWACVMYGRALQAEAECEEAYELGHEDSEDLDSLVASLAFILAHNRIRRGWELSGLRPALRDRVNETAKDMWDTYLGKRG